jgi:hypothetical protein
MKKLLVVILILLSGSISVAQSITKPASKKFELNVSGQVCSGFVLNGFATTDILLASIGFINPPAGTTFNITTTMGLTPASGFTLTGNKARLVFTGTMVNINNALASLKINTGATAGNVQISVSATLNPTGFYYNPINGHFYKPVTTGASYTAARAASLLTTFKGQTGYLVTITSADENSFIFVNVPQANIWFAATDEVTDGRWVIDAGPEKGTVMKTSNGQTAGNITGVYNNWAGGEPNGYNHSEDYAVTNWGGASTWNDLSNNYSNPYIIEYGTWTNPDSQTFTDFYSANVINPIDVPSSKVNFYFGGNINPSQWSVKSYTANGVTPVSTTTGLTLGANGSVINTSDFVKSKTDMVMYLSKLSATTLTNFYWSVLTVGDAYLAFQELSDRGLSGTESKAFTNGVQFLNGDIDGNNVFDEKDSYRILRHVIGSETLIVSTWNEDNLFRLIKKSTFDAITKSNWTTTNVPYKANYPLPVDATINDYVYDVVVALKGDVNMSHTIAQNTQATASINRTMNLTTPMEVSTYVSSEIVDGKVVVSIKVKTLGQLLKGVQLKLNYDSDILKYESTEYTTSGNPLNFSNDIGNFINFGSLIYNGTGLLNDNTEYKLIFTPKETITNTIGLTSIEGIDAINVGGSTLKIKNL